MNSGDHHGIFLGNLPAEIPRFKCYLHLGKEIKVFEGETIENPHRGDDDSFLFYVKQGGVKFCVTRPDGLTLDFAYLGVGAIMQKNTPTTTIDDCDLVSFVAAHNSILVSFTKDQFFEFLGQDRVLFDEYMNCISTYNVLQKQRILMTAGLSSSQRLLSWLAKLCNKTQPNTRGWYKIPCTLTQQQIADILFIHVTTCNKLFSRLYKEGIAERTRSHIVIYQFDKMKQYLEEDWKLLY